MSQEQSSSAIMVCMNLDGVDVDWVRAQLSGFVRDTGPVNQSSSGNGMVFVTSKTLPQCGRPRALELSETVRPILDRLYQGWRLENPGSKNDEFKSERDAASRLLARLDSHEELARRLGGADDSPRISAAQLHPLIWQSAKAQWSTGHRHEAVHAATKAVNSLLQSKVGRRDVSEQDLVKQAFSEKPPEPGKPRLRFGDIGDEQTRNSMRNGALQFGSGCFASIRNPVGHLPNEEVELDEQTALEQLAALSLFARWIDRAELESAE